MSATWPREHAPAGDAAVIKAAPEDFRVEEVGAVETAGAGEHLYLRLEKTGLATPEVARWLARCCRVPETAVGYAGMKDKRAITEQWFSVHTSLDADALPARAGIRVLAATRHQRKLRRGQLRGNRFRLRLRDVIGESWPRRLDEVGEQGVPNYFGPQRFGVDNLPRARAWLDGRRQRRRPTRDFGTGLHLSVLRSFLFNEVLAARVRHGSWNRLLPGDVTAEPLPQAECAVPSAAMPGLPTGPLWGRGRSPAGAEALALERAALAPHAKLCDGLEHAGVTQQRRSLVLEPMDLCWQRDGRDVVLEFALPPGGYATTLLAGVFRLSSPAGAP